MNNTEYLLQWSAIFAWFIFCVVLLPRWLRGPNAPPKDKDSAGGCGLAIFVTTLGIAIGWAIGRWASALSIGMASALLSILIVACSAL